MQPTRSLTRFFTMLAATLLTLVLLVVALLALVPTERLVNAVIRDTLDTQGLVLDSLQIERFGLAQTQIAQLVLRDAHNQFGISLTGLALHYSLEGLRQGRLEEIRIDQADIQLQSSADEDAGDQWQDILMQAMGVAETLLPLPLQALQIEQLMLVLIAPDGSVQEFALQNVAATFSPAQAELQAELSALDALNLDAPLIMSASFAPDQQSALIVAASAPAQTLDQLARSVMTDLPLTAQLVSGTVALQLHISADTALPQPHVSGEIIVSDLGGQYGEVLFSGAESVLALQLDEQSFIARGPLNVATADIGIPLTRISTDLELQLATAQQPVVELRNLLLHLLGGNLSQSNLRLDFNQPVQQFSLAFANLDLAQIVSLHQVDGLHAEGRLRGQLPLRWDAQGLRLHNGALSAQRPGGVIRYQPGAGGALLGDSSAQGATLLQALNNFAYSSLEATANYRPDGTLLLALAFQGKNVEQFGEKPIHFNLTLEQNVLSLLRSLRAAKGISDGIDAAVQNFYQEKNQP